MDAKSKMALSVLKPFLPMAEEGILKLMAEGKNVELQEGESQPGVMIWEKDEKPWFAVVMLNEKRTGYTRILQAGPLMEFIQKALSNGGK